LGILPPLMPSLGMEGCTPVFLFVYQKQVRIIIFLSPFLLCNHKLEYRIFVCDMGFSILNVCSRDFFILTKCCDVSNLLTLAACIFCMPILWFPSIRLRLPCVICESNATKITGHTSTGVIAFPLVKVVIGISDGLRPLIAACQQCVLETSDHTVIVIRVGAQDHCCTEGILPHFLGDLGHFSYSHRVGPKAQVLTHNGSCQGIFSQ
jgi:hypothetical protein